MRAGRPRTHLPVRGRPARASTFCFAGGTPARLLFGSRASRPHEAADRSGREHSPSADPLAFPMTTVVGVEVLARRLLTQSSTRDDSADCRTAREISPYLEGQIMSVDIKTEDDARESDPENQAAWDRVYTAVTTRWPEIDQLELLECRQCVDEISEYLNSRVDAADEEVRSVVAEFSPQPPSTASVVTEAAGDVIERIQYEIDEAPVKSSLTGVMVGFSLGVLVTTIYSIACRKAEMQRRGWFS